MPIGRKGARSRCCARSTACGRSGRAAPAGMLHHATRVGDIVLVTEPPHVSSSRAAPNLLARLCARSRGPAHTATSRHCARWAHRSARSRRACRRSARHRACARRRGDGVVATGSPPAQNEDGRSRDSGRPRTARGVMTNNRTRAAPSPVSVALAIAFAVRWVRQARRSRATIRSRRCARRAHHAAALQRPRSAARRLFEDQRALVLDLALKRHPAAAGCGAVQRAFRRQPAFRARCEDRRGRHGTRSTRATCACDLESAPGARDAWFRSDGGAVRAELAQTPSPSSSPAGGDRWH